jgi:hypothetical protein
MTKNAFKSPHTPLRSSWVQLAFKKEKTSNVVKKSLGNHPTPIIKNRGDMFTRSSMTHSNLY